MNQTVEIILVVNGDTPEVFKFQVLVADLPEVQSLIEDMTV